MIHTFSDEVQIPLATPARIRKIDLERRKTKIMKITRNWKALLSMLVICAVALVAPSANAKEREITVALKVPDGAWNLAIDEVRQVKKELWVVAVLSRDPNVGGIQMITTLKAKAKLKAPELPVKVFVIGKTWNWEGKEPYKFIKNRKKIAKDLDTGKLLYKKPEKKKK